MKKLLVLLILAAAALAAGAYWINAPHNAAMSEGTFTFARIERGDLADTVSGTGTLQPRKIVLVTCETPGVVVEVSTRVNDTVDEGDLLARLDDRRLRLKMEEAEASAATARAYLLQAQSEEAGAQLALKYQTDVEDRGGFRSDRDLAQVKRQAAQAGVVVAQGKVRSAEAAVREAKLALDQAEVRVPVTPRAAGTCAAAAKRRYVVLERKVESGQTVGPAAPAPLFTLAEDLGRMEVHTEVAEGDIDRVRVGLPARFTISSSAAPEQRFKAKVRQIRPMPASVKGAVYYNVLLDVENQKNTDTGEWRLRPGMTASVDLVLRRHTSAWKVPTAALSFQLEEGYQTPSAQARLTEWQARPDRADWKPVWIWDTERRCPWPIFVRVADSTTGRAGIKDGDFNEILEWAPGQEPRANLPGPRVITNALPAHAPGFFDQPANIKVS